MPFYFTPWIIPPLLSALVNGTLAVYAWHRRRVPAAGWFLLLAIGMSGWSLSYALNTAATELWLKNLFFKTGGLFVCLMFFVTLPMTLVVMGRTRRFSRPALVLFGLVPFMSSLIVLTNDLHGLMRHTLHLVTRDGLVLMGYIDGWYYTTFHLIYAYLYYLLVMFICLTGMLRRSQTRRSSLALILVATLVPLATDMLNLAPVKELRLTTASLFISGICYWLAVFRFQLLNLVPLARATLFEQMTEPVLIIDSAGCLAERNRSADRLLSLSADAIGRPLDLLFPPGSLLHGIRDPDRSLTRHDKASDCWWQLSLTPLQHGAVSVGHLVVLHDVTELTHAKEHIRMDAERFQRLADESADTVWQLDTDLRFTYINAADQAIRGFTPDEVLGATVYDFLPEADAEKVRQANIRRLQDERSGIRTGPLRYELQMLCKDGSLVWIEANANPLRDEHGTIIGYIGISRDISRRKAIEEENAAALAFEQKARAEQDHFLSMLSHEYRTPLAIIQANLDLLELKEQSAGQHHTSRIVPMKRAINRLVEIMSNLLQKTRMEDLSANHDAEPIAPVELLDGVIDSAEQCWGNRLFLFDPEPITKTVRGNPVQLRTALSNLLDNACKYSPEQTPIIIECRENNAMVTITICNSGMPLSNRDIGIVFEKFKRGSNCQGISGAGLGLWLVRRIVEQHGGSVQLSSTPETGTIVTLNLPAIP